MLRRLVSRLLCAALALSVIVAMPVAASAEETEKEAPILAELVTAGELPALEDRLPSTPKLINNFASDQFDYASATPVYGGTLTIGSAAKNQSGDFNNSLTEWLVNSPGLYGDEITGNVFESMTPNDDYTVYTVKMREGMKWSDGVDVTTEDIAFTYEHVLLNEQLTTTFPSQITSPSGTPGVIEIQDEYTFTISFDESYPGLLRNLALMGANYDFILKPAHYLEQYHIDFAKDMDAYKAQVEAAGFTVEEWYLYFNDKDITLWEMLYENAIGFPSLSAWILTSVDLNKAVCERNPYYWKVDLAGRQLPYMDAVEVLFVSDTEVLNNMLLSGDLEFSRESPSIQKLPLYIENETVGNYKTYVWNYHGRLGNIFLNQSYDADAEWSALVNQVEFRQAVSYAIDRQQILDSIFYEQGTLPETFGDATYDAGKANELLDGLGLTGRDANGWRTYASGNAVSIAFEVTGRVPENEPIVEMVVEMLQEVGINATMKVIDTSLFNERRAANQIQATCERMEAYWFRADVKMMYWAPAWYAYLTTNGTSGAEPPEDVQELYAAIKGVSTLPDAQAKEAFASMAAMQKANLYYIPIMDDSVMPFIMTNRLGNTELSNVTSMLVNFSLYELYLKD